jgi:four helix bundle protein
MKSFREMPVWQKAFKIILTVYSLSKKFPDDEKFVLTSDMRRAANSIAHNIAEGFGRFQSKDKSRFYTISRGSAYELISQILVAVELDYIKEKDSSEDLIGDIEIVIGDLNSIMKSINTKP